MSGLKELLDRESERIRSDPGALDHVLHVRDRRRRTRRVGTAVLALVVAGVSIALVARAFSTGSEPVPASGTTWSRVPDGQGVIAGHVLRAVTSWRGTYVAFGEPQSPGTGGSVVLTSTDAIHWRAVTQLNGIVWGATGDGPRMVAVGFGPVGAAVWTSDDATTWTSADVHDPCPASTITCSDAGLFGVASGGPGYIAVGSFAPSPQKADRGHHSGFVWTSTDGRTWIPVPDERPFAVTGREIGLLRVMAGGPGLIAWGTDRPAGSLATGPRTAAAWTSHDGVSWTRVPGRVPGGPMFADGDRVLAFGAVADARHSRALRLAVFASPDGVAWTEAPGSAAGFAPGAGVAQVVRFGGRFVAVGNGIWSSPDGITWHRRARNEDCSFNGVAVGPAGLAAVGPGCMWTTATIPPGPRGD